VSWVCGEGRVDRAGSTMSHEDKSCRGCYLGISHERGTCDGYMRQGEVLGWSVFVGRSPRMGGVVLAWGARRPVEWGIGCPL
jgi:hypothetical protein